MLAVQLTILRIDNDTTDSTEIDSVASSTGYAQIIDKTIHVVNNLSWPYNLY